MVKLGLNIDHVATVREARYRDLPADHPLAEPSPLAAAEVAVAAGVHSITAHLREDRRHIRDEDIFLLKERLAVPLNLEMAVTDEMVGAALKVKPADVCLVPENRREVTTEGGLDAVGQFDRIVDAVARLAPGGIAVSLFIDPDETQIRAAQKTGAPCIELHTGAYANALDAAARDRRLAELAAAAELARGLGLRVNAGHGLNYRNLPPLLAAVPGLDTLNIGHAVVARAIFVGLAAAAKEMLALLSAGRAP